MDFRKNVRFRLSVNVLFKLEGLPGDGLRDEGPTRDVSLAGALIFTSTWAQLHAISAR